MPLSNLYRKKLTLNTSAIRAIRTRRAISITRSARILTQNIVKAWSRRRVACSVVISVDTRAELGLIIHRAILRAVGLDHPVAGWAARRDVFDGGRRGDAADQAGHAGCVEVVDGSGEA